MCMLYRWPEGGCVHFLVVAWRFSYCLNITITIKISTSQSSHAAVGIIYDSSKWVHTFLEKFVRFVKMIRSSKENKVTSYESVLTEISEYKPLSHFTLLLYFTQPILSTSLQSVPHDVPSLYCSTSLQSVPHDVPSLYCIPPCSLYLMMCPAYIVHLLAVCTSWCAQPILSTSLQSVPHDVPSLYCIPPCSLYLMMCPAYIVHLPAVCTSWCAQPILSTSLQSVPHDVPSLYCSTPLQSVPHDVPSLYCTPPCSLYLMMCPAYIVPPHCCLSKSWCTQPMFPLQLPIYYGYSHSYCY